MYLVKNIYQDIKGLILNARQDVLRSINSSLVCTYFLVGKIIVENEQKGKLRAEYADKTIVQLAKKLTNDFGKGFSKRNLENMRSFYIIYKEKIVQTAPAQLQSFFKLSWSHYVFLIRIDSTERSFYEIEAIHQNWSLRELERQYNSSLYERLALSRNKKQIAALSKKGLIISKPQDALKNPYVLEFLGLEEKAEYSESDLEQAIINKLEHFILELGKGFLFVGRQKRITLDEDHYYIDLVFYNRLLKCFVLVDLKIGKLTHQDIGQMQMYVNYYDRKVKANDENNTIGIVLCKDAKNAVVEYTLPKNNKQIFARRYKLYLPSKTELKKQLEIVK